MRVLYTLAMLLATPLLLGHLALRGFRNRDYWRRWGERFAFGGRPLPTGGIVVHAVSVGEVNAAAPLIEALGERWPDCPLTVTCFTPTGSDQVRHLFGDDIAHRYLPIDLPGAVRRFMNRTQPRLLIIMETEIWVNLYREAHARGIPIMLANARISNRSMKRYRRIRGITRLALGVVDTIAAQSPRDADRLTELGARPEAVRVTGNLKFDMQPDPTIPTRGAALRAGWGSERPVWVAGSTHDLDEQTLLEAHATLLERWPDLLLVLVPRHPERFARGGPPFRQSRLHVAQRSLAQPAHHDTQVYLADTMGELLNFYAAADIAFVGGSFAPIGGHNALEPAALGKPVLFGPHMQNSADITEQLIESGGARQVEDAEALVEVVDEWLASPGERARAAEQAQALVDSGRGAVPTTVTEVERLLAPDANDNG